MTVKQKPRLRWTTPQPGTCSFCITVQVDELLTIYMETDTCVPREALLRSVSRMLEGKPPDPDAYYIYRMDYGHPARAYVRKYADTQ